MKTVKVKLTAQQISMLLGCLYEAKQNGFVDPSEFDLFHETESIIEQAENDICRTLSNTLTGCKVVAQ